MLVAGSGCGNGTDLPPSDPDLREALGLDDQVRIHRIDLSGRGAESRVLPATLEIQEGEVVQFVTLDRRIHHIRFVTDSLSPAAARFLEQTGQSSSPPLVRRGSRFVLSFEGAPAGLFPYVVEGYGDPVVGRIRVRPPP